MGRRSQVFIILALSYEGKQEEQMHVRITNKTIYASAMYFSGGFNQLTAWPLTFINLELIIIIP